MDEQDSEPDNIDEATSKKIDSLFKPIAPAIAPENPEAFGGEPAEDLPAFEPGPAKPAEIENERPFITVATTIPYKLRDRLVAHAKKERKTKSFILKTALKSYLDAIEV